MTQSSLLFVQRLWLIPWMAVSLGFAKSETRAEETNTITRTNSPAELFKAFITSPPPIENIVVKVKVAADPRRTNVGLENSTNYQHYEARWQTNAIFVRAIDGLNDLTNRAVRGLGCFTFDRDFWLLERHVHAVYWYNPNSHLWQEPPNVAKTNYGRAFYPVQYLRSVLAEVLNMGVCNLDIGTIRWHGNRFEETYAERNQRISGLLATTEDGFPSTLYVNYLTPTHSRRVAIQYSFRTNVGLPYLPDRIRILQLTNDTTIERGEMMILSLKVGSGPASQKAFDARPFIDANYLDIRYFTNGALYTKNLRGQLVLARQTPKQTVDQNTAKLSFYVAIGLTTLSFFVLMVRMKRKEPQTE